MLNLISVGKNSMENKQSEISKGFDRGFGGCLGCGTAILVVIIGIPLLGQFFSACSGAMSSLQERGDIFGVIFLWVVIIVAILWGIKSLSNKKKDN